MYRQDMHLNLCASTCLSPLPFFLVLIAILLGNLYSSQVDAPHLTSALPYAFFSCFYFPVVIKI